jgi:hypothetical protein
MAKSRRKATKSGGSGDGRMRWIIVLGALGIAALAIHLLMNGGGDDEAPAKVSAEPSRPALDDIDSKSRKAMRDLLRDAGD